ncbi:hypothetical protein [Streptomyces sp. NPDC048385]|uniref:hypothetical protein n=1 Tax=unclassified Streptomyces TaxID=2593676 RepID=UPI003433B220
MIPSVVRERLAIATAQYDNCTYCLSGHTCIGHTPPRPTPRGWSVSGTPSPPTRARPHADSGSERPASPRTSTTERRAP